MTSGLGRIADVQALYVAHTVVKHRRYRVTRMTWLRAVYISPRSLFSEQGGHIKNEEVFSCLLFADDGTLLAGCGQQKTDDNNSGDAAEPALADGVYTADFNTDSSMFHANETCDGKGVLTVKDGQMTIHVSLASTSIVNLFPGLKEDAQKDGAVLLQPTKDTVTYPDGLSEEVNGFDIPVPALDTEFDVALIGKKGVWYDHKVSVSNPVLKEDDGDDAAAIALADGTYTIEVGFEGGSGKSHVLTPCTLKVENGAATATIVWSSEEV